MALAAICASAAMADIQGSTYTFATSVTGNTQISPLGSGGTHTDPANPGFCVGPPVACGSGSGVSGSFSFATVSPTLDTITFQFFGSTAGAGPGTFKIDLGNFVTLDGETITNVTHASGNLFSGDFTSVSWNGTDAVFTGSTSSDFDAVGGVRVVFDVDTTGAVPEPASIALLLTIAGFMAVKLWKRRNVTATESQP